MPPGNLKGMILAAGFGTRMRPLTHHIPKPMLPVLGVPIIDYQAALLKKAGITRAVVNLHHLGNRIEEHVSSGGLSGLSIEYSRETGEILGTGGGLFHARRYFDESTVVLVNGDTLIDFDLTKIIEHHFRNGAYVTMLLKRSNETPDENSIYVDASGRVKRLVGHGARAEGLVHCAFLGVHVLEPAVFRYLPESGCIIRKAYTKMVDEGLNVTGMLCEADYSDIGTPASLLDINLKLLKHGSYIGSGCLVEKGAVIGKGSVLSGENTILTGAVVEDSLVLKGETIGNGERLSRTIAGFGLRLEV